MSIYSSKITTKTTTSVLLATTQVCASNPSRKGLVIWNNSTNSAYVSFFATGDSATCTYIVPTFASLTLLNNICYTGPISAIRNSGTGNLTCWELE